MTNYEQEITGGHFDAAVEAADTLSPEALIQAAFESGELFVAEHFVFITVP